MVTSPMSSSQVEKCLLNFPLMVKRLFPFKRWELMISNPLRVSNVENLVLRVKRTVGTEKLVSFVFVILMSLIF